MQLKAKSNLVNMASIRNYVYSPEWLIIIANHQFLFDPTHLTTQKRELTFCYWKPSLDFYDARLQILLIILTLTNDSLLRMSKR